MKAVCNVVNEGRSYSLSFSHTHMYRTICDYEIGYLLGSSEEPFPDTTHYLICDLDLSIDSIIGKLSEYRKSGIKVILMVFDPAAFLRVDNLISNNALDKVVVFDSKFKDRFRVKTYVSDYFFNEKVFPLLNVEQEFKDKVCVFGHLSHGRYNNFNLPQIDILPHIKSYRNLYSEVQKYNGVAVYDTGLDENRYSIVSYNKAKFVESLMCGVNGYCKEGINTKRYNRFLKKYDDIPNVKPIDFTQEEIFKINDLTVKELIYELEYI